MKLLFSLLHKVIAFLARTPKKKKGVVAGEYPCHEGGSGQKAYTQRKRGRFSKLKRLIRERKTSRNVGYDRPVTKKRRLKIIGVPLALASLFAVMMWAGGMRTLERKVQSIAFFQVSEVLFSGCSKTLEGKLYDQSDIIIHQTSLIGLETEVIERLLLGNPWISKARVTRNWPSTIEIDVKEYVPVALLHKTDADTDQLFYLDKKGNSFLQVAAGVNVDYPVITGLSELGDPVSKKAAMKEVLLFLKKVGNNDPYLPLQAISEVNVDSSGELVVYLVEYPFPIYFGNGNTKEKYRNLVRVMRTLYKKKGGKDLISNVKYIQMDYLDNKVLVAQSESGL